MLPAPKGRNSLAHSLSIHISATHAFVKHSQQPSSAPSERATYLHYLYSMIVSVFSSQPYDREFLSEAFLSSSHQLIFLESGLNFKTAQLASGSHGICAFVNDHLDSLCLDALYNLGIRHIFLRCAGFNQVDLSKARQLRLNIYRVPAYSPESVAEHAAALLLTLNRKTHKAFNRVRENNFSLDRLTGFQISGKVVGIVGTGKIGAAFARIMKGFGCSLLAFDPLPNKALTAETGIQFVEWEQLLAKSDIISLHCPLRPETRHLINKESLHLIKPGAMLINTSRGGLIDTKAAIDALQSGQLAYLGIDVYEQEESLFFRDRSEEIIDDQVLGQLLHFPNVLVTAHQAFFTKEALKDIAMTTLANVNAADQNLPIESQLSL